MVPNQTGTTERVARLQPPDTFEQYFEFLRRAKQDGQTGAIFAAGDTGGLS